MTWSNQVLGCVKWLNCYAFPTYCRMRFKNLRPYTARDLSGYCSARIPSVRCVSPCEKETSPLLRRNFPLIKPSLIGKVYSRRYLVMESSLILKQEFFNFYPKLLNQLKSSRTLEELPLMRDWVEKVIEYNTLGGKLNRGIALVESFVVFSKEETLEEKLEEAFALGWAVELLQAFFLVADDIMDGSLTRRGKPCWYRTNNLGTKAFNDSILLESAVFQIVSIYCKQHPSYLPILELFHDVTMRTSLGQSMDLHLAPENDGKPDLDKFTIEAYDNIAKFKTAYYSFYLPVAVAMHLAGFNDEKLFQDALNILLPMGKFFQVQDDYLDCFGDPEVTGKVGTDIEEGKCSWLVVKALSLCDSSQRKVLEEHYGSCDPESVQAVKALYKELKLPQHYAKFEESSYQELITMIEQTEELSLSSVLRGFVGKIYKRSN